ncbi:hypothetical protein ZWY2020_013986 [Hordeum vulgare]|nr:hypothetical protein ZWY2020_013986 [Hordeum vulgare]
MRTFFFPFLSKQNMEMKKRIHGAITLVAECSGHRQRAYHRAGGSTQKRNLEPEADIWSVGVILYILLQGRVDFTSDPYFCSPAAKDLVKKDANSDPKEMSAYDVLEPCLDQGRRRRLTPLDNADVMNRLKQFQGYEASSRKLR